MSLPAAEMPEITFSGITIPDIPADDDGQRAAFRYVRQGLYIGPIAQKSKNPGSVLGKWTTKTFADSEHVVQWWDEGDWGVFLHAGRSGLVVLDVDDPTKVPAAWWPYLDAAPYQNSRPGMVQRGHYLFATPPGRMIGNSLGTSREGWGEVRGINGVIVVAPTIHEKAADGAKYQWVRTGPVPVLPNLIADTLPEGKPGEQCATDAAVKTFLSTNVAADPDADRFKVEAIVKFHKDVEAKRSRHEAAVSAACWIARESGAGWYEAQEALNMLFDAFQGSFTQRERQQGRGGKSEFQGILSWAIGQLTPTDIARKQEQLDAKRSVTYLQHRRAARETDDQEGSQVAGGEDQGEAESRKDLRTGSRGKGGRVRINVGVKPAAMTFLREELGGGELSGLFMRGSHLVHTPRVGENGYVPPKDGDDGPAQVREVSLEGLISMIEVRYDVGTVKERKAKTPEQPEGEVDLMEAKPAPKTTYTWEPALLPRELGTRCVGSAIVGEGTPNLHRLKGVTHTPVMRADGTILDEPGFDPATSMLYLPPAGADPIRVPEFPTKEQIGAARETILYPIGEFPWVSDDDLANWVGCALTPILRPLVPPPYQFMIIEAPSPGSGKGFLLGILNAAHGVATRPGMPGKDEDMSKFVATMLSSTTAPIVAFDNVRGVVKSAVLEGVLTTDTVTDRTLGKNTEALILPNDRLWGMTGNNAQFGGDLARRALRITIDPGIENPEGRTGFRCQPVRWTREHRAEYVGALLTIARAWVVAGRPVEPLTRSDDYDMWVQTIRGILAHAGFSGTFSNREEKAERSADDEQWGRFLEAIYDVVGDGDFTAREVHGLISEFASTPGNREAITPDVLPPELVHEYGKFGKESAFIAQLAQWFKNRVGRWADGLAVEKAGMGTSRQRKNIALYRIKESSVRPGAATDRGACAAPPVPAQGMLSQDRAPW